MKRRLTKLVLFLLLGAIVNLVVAWGLVMVDLGGDTEKDVVLLGSRGGGTWWRYRSREGERLTVYMNIVPPALDRLPVITKGWWTPHNAHFRSLGDGHRYPSINLLYFAYGLPLRSMSGSTDRNWEGEAINYCCLMLPIQRLHQPFRVALPLRPIWPGFAINTIFYTAILWCVTFGPFTIRRMIRHKRGLCAKCGYDLRGAMHDLCPECGNATAHALRGDQAASTQ